MSQNPTLRFNRLTRCRNCRETFTYRYRVTPEQGDNLVINLGCPFCRTRLQVDLNPHTRKKITSYRTTADNSKKREATVLDPAALPAELPTRIRK